MKSSTKTNQFFRVIMHLSRGTYKSLKELSEELEIELRTIYRYIDDLKESDFFKIEQRGRRYRISRESLMWTSVSSNVFLTDKETMALDLVLEGIETADPTLKSLKKKVRNNNAKYIAPLKYDADVVLVRNTETIKRAIEEKRMVMLRGYTSLHSNTKSDRLVEPFAFLGNYNDVRCYELSSKKNKTFKVSRCDSVEFLDVQWQFEQKHKKMFTDLFNFSDEVTTRVRLILGTLAKTILLEEHPDATKYIIPHTEGHWLLDAPFCSMKGIARFYLGLYEDIEIMDSPEFKAYIAERIKTLEAKEL